ncbi:hypothetical protein KEM52_002039 [Ascosphaera acerosa]|nr:hypothetical protein KEM52_002039 [Ascosphaera acerosa]
MVFTSSALGRHYDQFLFKKKPDGVHNVDEIRQMRSNITRRTARTSGAAAEFARHEHGGYPASDAGSVTPSRPFPPGGALPEPLLPMGGGDPRQIAGARPAAGSGVVYQGYYNPFSQQGQAGGLNYASPDQLRSSQVQSDTSGKTNVLRAMELALREVLDTVRAATSRVQSRVIPFDFELRSQTFPSLCLHSLPPPPTINTTDDPFPSDTSFTIEPPTAALKEIVQTSLREKVERWREEQQRYLRSSLKQQGQSGLMTAHKLKAEEDLLERQARQHEEMILKHLDLSLKHWEANTPEQQGKKWHLEVMRALARERQKRQELEERLSVARQESDALRAKLEKVGSPSNFPPEFAMFPPDMVPVSAALARELKAESDPNRWDYDSLVAKWKRVVTHDRTVASGGTAAAVASIPMLNPSTATFAHTPAPPPGQGPAPGAGAGPGPSPATMPPAPASTTHVPVQLPANLPVPSYANAPGPSDGRVLPQYGNGYHATLHHPQAPPAAPDRAAQMQVFPATEPSPKRRRLSQGPTNHHNHAADTLSALQVGAIPQLSYQQPQQLQSQPPPPQSQPQPQSQSQSQSQPQPPVQAQAQMTVLAGPSPPATEAASTARSKRSHPHQQYRFKYTTGPGAPKASSFYSQPPHAQEQPIAAAPSTVHYYPPTSAPAPAVATLGSHTHSQLLSTTLAPAPGPGPVSIPVQPQHATTATFSIAMPASSAPDSGNAMQGVIAGSGTNASQSVAAPADPAQQQQQQPQPQQQHQQPPQQPPSHASNHQPQRQPQPSSPLDQAAPSHGQDQAHSRAIEAASNLNYDGAGTNLTAPTPMAATTGQQASA